MKAEKLNPGERRSLVFMLMGLFFLFCGTNAISTFFALFAAEILHKTTAQATIMTTAFAAASALAALPAGWLGKKIGRKKRPYSEVCLYLFSRLRLTLSHIYSASTL